MERTGLLDLVHDLAVCGALFGLICGQYGQKKRIDDFEVRLKDAVAAHVVADCRTGAESNSVPLCLRTPVLSEKTAGGPLTQRPSAARPSTLKGNRR